MANREELCSTQVEPSSTQENKANGENDAPTQEQAQDPLFVDQVAMQEPSSPSQDASQYQGQDQASTSQVEVTPQDDQGQHFGQDEDPNDQDDQVIIPRSYEDVEARHEASIARAYKKIDAALEKVAENLTMGSTTRGQLARFSEHHAHISMVEPKKVFEELEDSDWLEAIDRKSTRLNSSHSGESRMPSSA